jgi:hypothetical protein
MAQKFFFIITQKVRGRFGVIWGVDSMLNGLP